MLRFFDYLVIFVMLLTFAFLIYQNVQVFRTIRHSNLVAFERNQLVVQFGTIILVLITGVIASLDLQDSAVYEGVAITKFA